MALAGPPLFKGLYEAILFICLVSPLATKKPRPGLRAPRPRAWVPRVFLRQSNGRSAEAPSAASGGARWCSPTPQNHRLGQLAARIALGITAASVVLGRAGGWQGPLEGRANCAC
jgi:hypothetical protein